MRVAIVHDDLVQWGGAERVLLGISELFPESSIYTSSFDKNNSLLAEKFKNKKIITSFIDKIPSKRFAYRPFLPLYSMAFEQYDFSQYDLVISQTTKFAKSIITKPGTTHICYCHTPPRFIWKFSGQKISKWLMPYISYLRIYDQITAKRVDLFLAGSKNSQQRIKRAYQQDAKILYPFIDFEKIQSIESFDGDYYLIVARLNKYKNVRLAVEVFNKLGLNLKVVGSGPELKELTDQAKPNVEFLGSVSDDLLYNLLSGCKALIVTAEEDFGLTALEAQAFGKPVIAYGKGGNLETVEDKKTGLFFNDLSIKALEKAINDLQHIKINPQTCKDNAQKFSKEVFQNNLRQIVNDLSPSGGT